jgi:two-component sensor histidine kinase
MVGFLGFPFAGKTTRARYKIALALSSSTAILCGLAIWTWADFADVRSDAETLISAAAVATDHLARHSLRAIDDVLQSLVVSIEKKGLEQPGTDWESEHLAAFARRLPESAELSVVNKEGAVVAAVPSLSSPMNVSDREWFIDLKAQKVEPTIGRAVKGRGAHDLSFPVARTIRGRDGTFIGAARVEVEITYFAYFFRRLDVGSGAVFTLHRTTDGTVVARVPTTAALLGETAATLPSFKELASGDVQSWMGWSRSGGMDHLVSAHRLSGWPLIASVSLPKSEMYAGAWKRMLWRSIGAAATVAAITMLTVLASRQASREALLVRELEHRVKNMLGVVTAVIERALEDIEPKEGFTSSLTGRIRSMASTQTLLSQSPCKGVGLADLIGAELKPYANATNTCIDGPDVQLTPNAAHAMAMVIHELATNAAKYGPLSRQGGRVSVRWTLAAKGATLRVLKIDWQETGGPEVGSPSRSGYGSSVIRDLLPYEYGAKVDLAFPVYGVICTIEMPVTVDTLA